MENKAKYVIIVAGGSGTRMGAAIPKQFLLLKGLPVLMHTIGQFAKAGNIHIILVLPESQNPYWAQLCKEHNFNTAHTIAFGGDTRFMSVKNGLNHVKEPALIAVHDGVRPLVSTKLILSVFTETGRSGAVVPAIPVSESIRNIGKNNSKALNRDEYKLVQTPQCFDSTILKKAYAQAFTASFTDDASVVEASGVNIYLTAGEDSNIKITNPKDLIIAEALLSAGYLK